LVSGFASSGRHRAHLAVAIVAGTLLPYLAARDRRLLKPTNEKNVSQIDEDDPDEEEDAEMDKIREMVREWKAEAARHGRPLKLPTSKYRPLPLGESMLISVPFMLRNIWTAGLLLFALIMGSTFFITKVWQVSEHVRTALTSGDSGHCAGRYLLGYRMLGVGLIALS
jgi:solute carrier family 45 protein 1/2/4